VAGANKYMHAMHTQKHTHGITSKMLLCIF